MKKLMNGMLCLLCILTLVACSSDKEVSRVGLDEYKDLSKNPVIESIKFADAKQLLTDGSGVLILSFSDCPWCQSALPVVDEVAKELKMDNVYYLNIRDLSKEEDNNEYEALTALLADQLIVEDGEPVIYVPDVFAVKKGEVVGHHLGTTDEHDAYSRDMTEEEKAELVETYTELFNKIK